MNSISLTITDIRVIDGLVYAANSAGLSPQAYAELLVTREGRRYAEKNLYGVITGSAFVRRFTPAEYTAIVTASENFTTVPEAIGGVPTAQEQSDYDAAVATYSAIQSPTEADTTTYEAAVAAYEAASTPDNQAEIDAAELQNTQAQAVANVLNELTSEARVAMDDPRVQPGLDLLVSLGLLDASRPAELTAYDRPVAEVA